VILRHDEFTWIDAADFVKNPLAYFDTLKDKIVLLGYTTFRKWNFAVFDQMIANTPHKGDYNTYKNGDSMTFITALAIDNLVNNRWLVPAPLIVNMIQTLVIALLCALVWRLTTVTASISILAICGFCITLVEWLMYGAVVTVG